MKITGGKLLELHTLGVDGGYTQKDVTEVARCFTGWTIKNPQGGSIFTYNDRVHDKGEKIVLGVTGFRQAAAAKMARRCWTFWPTILRLRASFRRNWRSASWPTILRRH